MSMARFSVVAALMLAAVLTLTMRGDVDRAPTGAPLGTLPSTLQGRTSVDVPIDPEALQVLGKGIFLNRIYQPGATQTYSSVADNLPVGLFIGYFPTQRTGQAIHSPQNCLPGAGWTFESSRPIRFSDASGKPMQVGEYVITNGTARQEVLYWYRSHGRSISSDYAAKFLMLYDAIRYNRTDGALIRIITPIVPGQSSAAHDRAVAFAAQLETMLPAYIPD